MTPLFSRLSALVAAAKFNVTVNVLVCALCLGLASCSSDDPDPAPAQLPVNYANLSGNWKLLSYNDVALDEGTFMYICFERRDPHRFQMYDNLRSMDGLYQTHTGTYALEEDEKTETTVVSGFYDNGVGAWDSDYTVTSLTDEQLVLTSTDARREVQRYRRVETIPCQTVASPAAL